jgi:hypothetical protein
MEQIGHAPELRRRVGDDLRGELLGMGVLIDTVTKTWLGQVLLARRFAIERR